MSLMMIVTIREARTDPKVSIRDVLISWLVIVPILIFCSVVIWLMARVGYLSWLFLG